MPLVRTENLPEERESRILKLRRTSLGRFGRGLDNPDGVHFGIYHETKPIQRDVVFKSSQ